MVAIVPNHPIVLDRRWFVGYTRAAACVKTTDKKVRTDCAEKHRPRGLGGS